MRGRQTASLPPRSAPSLPRFDSCELRRGIREAIGGDRSRSPGLRGSALPVTCPERQEPAQRQGSRLTETLTRLTLSPATPVIYRDREAVTICVCGSGQAGGFTSTTAPLQKVRAIRTLSIPSQDSAATANRAGCFSGRKPAACIHQFPGFGPISSPSRPGRWSSLSGGIALSRRGSLSLATRTSACPYKRRPNGQAPPPWPVAPGEQRVRRG